MRVRLVIPGLLAAAIALAAADVPSLSIRNLVISEADGGQNVASQYRFRPGEQVYLAFQITGFTKKEDEDEHDHIKLEFEIKVSDKAGVYLAKPITGRLDEELARQDKDWLPKINRNFSLPDTLVTGDYHIQILVRDLIAETKTSAGPPLGVEGPRVKATKTLEIQNFQFFSDEDNLKLLPKAVYKPGDAVHVKFNISGFSTGIANSYQVGYGLKVLRVDRSQLFAQPKAATEMDATFYPRAYLVGAFHLNLDKTIAAGKYFLIVELTDELTGLKHETERSFEVH